jgi:T4 bacteriophage base plate protein.
MLVKEEKILLMAKESQDTNSIILAIKQIVNNCIVDKIDINKLAIFDLDYLYVKIRANSVDTKVMLSYVDEDDEPKQKGDKMELPTYNFSVDLNDVTVKFPDEKVDNVIKLGPDSGLKLKYPEVSVYDSPKLAKAQTAEAIVEEMIAGIFDSYFKGNKVYSFKDETRASIDKFIDGLDLETYNKVVSYFNNLPKIYYEVKFTNSKGQERTNVLDKLTDFFTF